MSHYVFDQTWERERERLSGLESLYDRSTTRYLAELGVSEGWQCLEVGCGAGSVALWLADRVGASGRVVATDLDTRFLDQHDRPNLDVRRHDILTGPPEEAAFDVVHARAVVEHIPDHATALANLLAGVRPGGWVLVEDVDFGGPMATALARYSSPAHHQPLIERVYRAGDAVFGMVGADASFGTRLVDMLREAGFEGLGGELHAAIVSGGTERWLPNTVEQIHEHMVRSGIMTADDVSSFLTLSADRSAYYAAAGMASVWGRRPLRDAPIGART